MFLLTPLLLHLENEQVIRIGYSPQNLVKAVHHFQMFPTGTVVKLCLLQESSVREGEWAEAQWSSDPPPPPPHASLK